MEKFIWLVDNLPEAISVIKSDRSTEHDMHRSFAKNYFENKLNRFFRKFNKVNAIISMQKSNKSELEIF